MRSIVDVAQSFTRLVSPTTDRPESESETERDETGQSSLYVCRSCNSVYIAAEKQSCSSCKTSVDRVSATLDET